jgi:hypothetical protein
MLHYKLPQNSLLVKKQTNVYSSLLGVQFSFLAAGFHGAGWVQVCPCGSHALQKLLHHGG